MARKIASPPPPSPQHTHRRGGAPPSKPSPKRARSPPPPSPPHSHNTRSSGPPSKALPTGASSPSPPPQQHSHNRPKPSLRRAPPPSPSRYSPAKSTPPRHQAATGPPPANKHDTITWRPRRFGPPPPSSITWHPRLPSPPPSTTPGLATSAPPPCLASSASPSPSSSAAAAAAVFATSPGLLAAGIVIFLLAMVAIIIGIWIHCTRRRSKVRDEVLVHDAESGHHPGAGGRSQREYLIPLSKVENGLEHRPSQLNADPRIREFLRPPRRLPPSALLGGACHDSGSGNKVAVNPLFRANPVQDQQKCWGNVVENCLIVSELQRPFSASLLQVDPLLRDTDPDQQGSRENVVENPLIFSEPFSASLLQVDTLLLATDPYQQGNQGNMGEDPLIVSTPEEVHEQPRPFSASLLRLRHPEDSFSAAHFEPAGKNMAATELPVCPREGMEQSHGREQGGKVADPLFRSGIVFDPGDGAAAVQKQILKVMEMEMEKKIHMMEPRIKRFSHRMTDAKTSDSESSLLASPGHGSRSTT